MSAAQSSGANAGCTVREVASAERRSVSVDGVEIGYAEIARETQHHPAAKPVEAWLAAARALAVRELLFQEACRLAIVPAPRSDAEGRRETDEEALVRHLVEREVVTPVAGEAECRRYYDNNRSRFRTPDLHEVRHILLAAPDDPGSRASAREKAMHLIGMLKGEPAHFAELAALHSACPSGKTGGCLGQIGSGQTVPEFEAALGSLPVGAISAAPVETRYGFHIVLVERRIDGCDLPYEAVRSRIASWLEEKARRSAIRQYIALLASRADIRGIDLGAGRGALVP
jgi:peptidyl-prolyl cis-trans isomerase C